MINIKHMNYLLAKQQLHIRQDIEEAYLKKKSLQQCLVDHLGESHGQEIYFQYTN